MYTCMLSYVEIYNEEIRDLLNPTAGGTQLRIHEDLDVCSFYLCCYITPHSLVVRFIFFRSLALTSMNHVYSVVCLSAVFAR